MEELIWKLCESATTNPRVPLNILHVFDDPGPDFLDLEVDFLVALLSDETHLVPLYFRYRGKFYNFVERSRSGRPSAIAFYGKDIRQHEFLAIHCILNGKTPSIMSTVGVQYATKYWTKHAYMASAREDNSLEKLRRVISQTWPLAERDRLYQEVLMACPLEHRATLLHILGFIFLQNPAFEGISSTASLLGISLGKMSIVLRWIQPVIPVTITDSKFHDPFADFIFSKRRSGQFFIDREKENLFFATKCIDYMVHHEWSWFRR